MRKRAIHGEKFAVAELERPAPNVSAWTWLRLLGPVVYAIRTPDGWIKIGFTTNLSQRSSQLGGYKALLAWRCGSMEDEQAIHASLNGQAIRGREYYPPTADVLSTVNAMRSELGLEPIAG